MTKIIGFLLGIFMLAQPALAGDVHWVKVIRNADMMMVVTDKRIFMVGSARRTMWVGRDGFLYKLSPASDRPFGEDNDAGYWSPSGNCPHCGVYHWFQADATCLILSDATILCMNGGRKKFREIKAGK